ncbi:HAD family hydrolase [Streptomyces sp. 1331.2]|uniref:HAD family hydrolase n=1 Tax=Streptomyces sp. 1331.2 TaxID=1938835 RepID=UPI000BCB63C4|nr:HAD family phosphatase [Streptomyces sp. 1331.2]SOB84617.1 sugar-phosphatase [Streptomyces sp. 1331.2]
MQPQAAGTRYEVEAVVFDMDGVLIDSRPVIEEAWRSVARRHSRVLADPEIEEYVHGRTGDETVRLIFPHHSDADRKAIWAEVDTVEEEAPYRAVPGADGLATRLRQAGVPVGLATSSWTRKIDNALGGLGLLDVFRVRVTRDDVERGKPHPDPYLSACRGLGVRPQRTLVFEDSVSGVRSAVAAGAVCVGIGGTGAGRALVEAGAVVAVADFTALAVDRSGGTITLADPDGLVVVALTVGPDGA